LTNLAKNELLGDAPPSNASSRVVLMWMTCFHWDVNST